MGDSITVNIKLTEDDHCWNKKYLFWQSYLFLAVIIASIFYGVILAASSNDYKDSFVVISIVGLIISVILFVILYFLFKKSALKSCKNEYSNDKLYQKENTYCIHNDGLDLYSENSSTKLKWDDLYAFKETKESLLIFLSPNKFYIMPKKCFNDEAQIDAARSYFNNIPIKTVNKRRRIRSRIILWAIILLLFILIYLIYR